MILSPGLKFTSKITVTESLTAEKMDSGDMPVLATPALVALMENAAMMAVAPALQEGQTTVGTAVSTSHLKASAVGAGVRAEAELTAVEGRKLTFKVSAWEGDALLGEGEHTRFVVDRERFLAKLV